MTTSAEKLNTQVIERLDDLIRKYHGLNVQHFQVLTEDERWEFSTIVTALELYRHDLLFNHHWKDLR